MRAFFISGNKAQFSGVDPQTGEKRFRTVGVVQDKVTRTVASLPKATPGSFIDFQVNPTITALASMQGLAGYTTTLDSAEQNINSSGLLDILSIDFSRSLKDLAAILNDLKRLSALGDLPITYRGDSATVRVHFPGCDADSVERLCQEIGVQRGVIYQDEDFDFFAGTEIALLFPFAPSETPSETVSLFRQHIGRETHAKYSKPLTDPIEWHNMISPSRSACTAHQFVEDDEFSVRSEAGVDPFEDINPWMSSDQVSSPEGYESMSQSSEELGRPASPLEYQEFEGIRKFIELCDGARGR